MSRIPKRSPLRGAERPHWEAADPCSDLHYLGWGVRDYGRYPTATDHRDMWSYTLILRGSPTLLLPSGPLRLSVRQAILVSLQGRKLGFRDQPGSYSEVLIWVWRTPPTISQIRPVFGGYRICDMSGDAIERLKATHAACRREIASPDQFGKQMLRLLRGQIDTEFVRHLIRGEVQSSDQLRAESAVLWLKQHLYEANAILFLSDYLQVSHSTLDRLFRDVLGESPSEYHRRLRMEEARRLRDEQKLSVKEIAYRLGYRQPNAFSRAFRAYQSKTGRKR